MKKLGFDLILLGDPAAGKDTQSEILARKYPVKLAASGKYLRKYHSKEYVQGKPFRSDVILEFIRRSIKNAGGKDLIFVGAARLKNEAQFLVKQLNQKKRNFLVIYIKLPKVEIIRRSFKRAERPEDTNLQLINSRIKYFQKQVSQTVKFYKNLKKLKFVNGNQSIKRVNQDIVRIINDYQRSQRN